MTSATPTQMRLPSELVLLMATCFSSLLIASRSHAIPSSAVLQRRHRGVRGTALDLDRRGDLIGRWHPRCARGPGMAAFALLSRSCARTSKSHGVAIRFRKPPQRGSSAAEGGLTRSVETSMDDSMER